ncbi:MAG: CorA family divalent cation transporter [Bacteroidota bacterium]
MLQTIKSGAENSFTWIDVNQPSEQELMSLAIQYGLPETAIKDCLDPEHLPKFEQLDDKTFIIIRNYDATSDGGADSMQKLTRKIAIFYAKDFLLTIHRHESKIINNVVKKYANSPICKSPFDIICKIVKDSLQSFEEPLMKLDNEIDLYETRIFLKNRIPDFLKNLYLIKRKMYVQKRLITLTKTVIDQLGSSHKRNTIYEDLRDTYVREETITEEIYESIHSLLNIYISLSSQKTNEVMRILTVFSAFFLPLTFIVGIYGMNFRIMPELNHQYGYPGILIFMFLITIVIYQWFSRKGWI